MFSTMHGTGIAGGKGFRWLCRLPAAKPDRPNRQRKLEKFALYITKNGHNLRNFAENIFYMIKKIAKFSSSNVQVNMMLTVF